MSSLPAAHWNICSLIKKNTFSRELEKKKKQSHSKIKNCWFWLAAALFCHFILPLFTLFCLVWLSVEEVTETKRVADGLKHNWSSVVLASLKQGTLCLLRRAMGSLLTGLLQWVTRQWAFTGLGESLLLSSYLIDFIVHEKSLQQTLTCDIWRWGGGMKRLVIAW